MNTFMKRVETHSFMIGCVLSALLLVECAPSSIPVSNRTIIPSPTVRPSPVPTNTLELTATAEVILVTPLVTAPYLEFASWSPDSQWIAYWVSSQEDVEQSTNFMPGGTLNFRNVISGETCAVSQFTTPHSLTANVYWSEEMEAIIAMGEETFTGKPCQSEPYRKTDSFLIDAPPNAALSPDGNYHVNTLLESDENGILTFETSITPSGSSQSEHMITWQIDERLGEYGLGGEWISKEQFLLYETLAQGPLIIDVEQGILPVAQLFGLGEIPSITGTEGYSLRAIPLPGMERDSFHLILQGVGIEANFPTVMLYHAENGNVEKIPFQYVWWKPFSADGQWLLMDERPDVNGYETYTISIRAIEDVGGVWRQIAADVDSVLWNTDWSEMAFHSDEIVTWQTFPEAELIRQWDTGQFWTYPAAWSPDGEVLVTIGNSPGIVETGLFILER